MLVVTTGERRIENLLALMREDGAAGIRLATSRAVREFGPLAAIWHGAEGDGPESFLEGR